MLPLNEAGHPLISRFNIANALVFRIKEEVYQICNKLIVIKTIFIINIDKFFHRKDKTAGRNFFDILCFALDRQNK